jgi:hypothetical protein
LHEHDKPPSRAGKRLLGWDRGKESLPGTVYERKCTRARSFASDGFFCRFNSASAFAGLSARLL